MSKVPVLQNGRHVREPAAGGIVILFRFGDAAPLVDPDNRRGGSRLEQALILMAIGESGSWCGDDVPVVRSKCGAIAIRPHSATEGSAGVYFASPMWVTGSWRSLPPCFSNDETIRKRPEISGRKRTRPRKLVKYGGFRGNGRRSVPDIRPPVIPVDPVQHQQAPRCRVAPVVAVI